jgi:hypothetical protein
MDLARPSGGGRMCGYICELLWHVSRAKAGLDITTLSNIHTKNTTTKGSLNIALVTG